LKEGPYAKILLQIGENGHIESRKLDIIRRMVTELNREIKNIVSLRTITRDPKIDKVIANESGSGLQFKGSIPDVMIEVRMDKNIDDTVLQKIATELVSTKIVKQIEILKPNYDVK
jgi:hypothetical protein